MRRVLGLARVSVVSLGIACVCKMFYDLPKCLAPQRRARPRGAGLPNAGRAGGQGHHLLDRGRDRRSNREMRVGGRSMLRVIGRITSYLEPTGLAATGIDVLALRVVIIPALAMETVCCS
jgi:hypothetical protein